MKMILVAPLLTLQRKVSARKIQQDRGADVTLLSRADVMTPCREDGPIQLAKTYLEACTMPGPISIIKLDKETVSAKMSKGKKPHPCKKTIQALAFMTLGKAASRRFSTTFSVSLQSDCRKSQPEMKSSKPVNLRRKIQKRTDRRPGNCYSAKKPFLKINIVEDGVAVLVPQKNISCIYKSRVKKQPVMSSHSSGVTRNSNKTECHPDTHCPVCDNDFQDEMTMLDHFLEIHRPLEMEPDMKESKARKRTVKKINKRENSDTQPPVETKTPAYSGYSKRYVEKQPLYPSVCGMVAGFSVKEWSSVAQIMTLTWLLGLDGFFHVLEQLLVEKSVDISRLKLLLSGDVEQNPGPMQCVCHWRDCNMVFSSVGSLSQHLMSEHSPASNTCNWKMCTYWDNDSDYCKLESHIISHVYQEEYEFLTIEELINALPNGKFSSYVHRFKLVPTTFAFTSQLGEL